MSFCHIIQLMFIVAKLFVGWDVSWWIICIPSMAYIVIAMLNAWVNE